MFKKDVKEHMEKAFTSITSKAWKKCVSFVVDIDNYYAKTKHAIEPVIIHLNSDQESDDSDSYTEDRTNLNSDEEESHDIDSDTEAS